MNIEQIDTDRFLIDGRLFKKTHPKIVEAGKKRVLNHSSMIEELEKIDFSKESTNEEVDKSDRVNSFKIHGLIRGHYNNVIQRGEPERKLPNPDGLDNFGTNHEDGCGY